MESVGPAPAHNLHWLRNWCKSKTHTPDAKGVIMIKGKKGAFPKEERSHTHLHLFRDLNLDLDT